jgi:hypothetical protein
MGDHNLPGVPKKEKKMNIEDAIKERDKYIEDHPHLKDYQKEIDSALEKAGDDTEKRLEVLATMAEGKFIEFQTAVLQLVHLLKDTKGEIE